MRKTVNQVSINLRSDESKYKITLEKPFLFEEDYSLNMANFWAAEFFSVITSIFLSKANLEGLQITAPEFKHKCQYCGLDNNIASRVIDIVNVIGSNNLVHHNSNYFIKVFIGLSTMGFLGNLMLENYDYKGKQKMEFAKQHHELRHDFPCLTGWYEEVQHNADEDLIKIVCTSPERPNSDINHDDYCHGLKYLNDYSEIAIIKNEVSSDLNCEGF